MILLYTLVRVQNVLVFSVEYQDSWRKDGEKPLVYQAKNGVEIMSDTHPLLSWAGETADEIAAAKEALDVAVYLRGTEVEKDRDTSVLTCPSPAAAADVEARVIAALAEVAQKVGSPLDDHIRLA